jgi:S-adenosylmethionine synthetase
VKLSYEWEDAENGKRTKKSETFTAFSWERTDKADALRADAGVKAPRVREKETA